MATSGGPSKGKSAGPVSGARRGLLGAAGILAIVIIGYIALEESAPAGPGEIDTQDPAAIAELVGEGVLPPGLPEGARVRAIWRGQEPAVEVWFHVSGASADAFRAFRENMRGFNGNLAALSRLGPPPWWSNFREPADETGVILRRAEGEGAFVVWRVETDRLLRIRGRRMIASARSLGLTE
ncbi:MAG: hypothetical protein AAFQ81_10690 [Pseudomonadota bacterium]